MAQLVPAEWDASLFQDLSFLLERIAVEPKQSQVRQLEKQLQQARPWLLQLTNVPRPSDASRAVLEKNPVIELPPRNGAARSFTLTPELAQIVNDLASLLSISQELAATLLGQAQENAPRYPGRSLAEVAVYTWHEWTNALLKFLQDLVVGVSTTEVAPFDALQEWVEELLRESTPVEAGAQGKKGTLVDQLLGQLDQLQGEMGRLFRGDVRPGDDLLRYRLEALRSDQCRLAGILATLAENGFVGRSQAIKIVRWLKTVDADRAKDGVVHLVLAVVMALFRPIESCLHYDITEEWSKDVKFMRLLAFLTLQDPWKSDSLRTVARVVFSLFYLSTMQDDGQVGLDPQVAEKCIADTANDDFFATLDRIVGGIADERAGALVSLQSLALTTNSDDDAFIFRQLQSVLDALIGRRGYLRDLRSREEDGNMARPYQHFMLLVAQVYEQLPDDSALSLWDDHGFINSVLELRKSLDPSDPRKIQDYPSQACFAMLSALSKGVECAGRSYERMSQFKDGWRTLFDFVKHQSKLLEPHYEPVRPRPVQLRKIRESEWLAIQAWMQLLTTVVRNSPLARRTLLSQAKTTPLETLFELLNRPIPLPVSVVLLDAITAFCAEPVGRARAVELHDRMTYQDPAFDLRRAPNAGGVNAGMIGWVQYVEALQHEARSFPVRLAHLRFFAALLPAESPRANNSLRRALSHYMDRLPGLMTCPLDREAERLELLEAVCTLLDKALRYFDLTPLQTQSIHAAATTLYDNPGFVVLLRILNEAKLFDVFAQIVDVVVQNRTPQTIKTALPVLRIYHRILDVQLVFSDVLLVALADGKEAFRRPLGLQSLDQYLLNRLSNIISIARLVGDVDPAVSYVSVRVVQALARSPVFSQSDMFHSEYSGSVNRLAGVIESSDESIQIAQGFCTKLDQRGEALSEDEIKVEGDKALRGEAEPSSTVMRAAILDILLDCTAVAHSPNLGHFLLGFDFRAQHFGLQDHTRSDSRLSCLVVVLRQLEDGLVDTDALLAAKSAQLVHQLFAHNITGKTTMGFAARVSAYASAQLESLPVQPASGDGEARIGTHTFATTAELLVAFIEYNKWVLSSAALDAFASDGDGELAPGIAELLLDGTDERPALLLDLLALVDVEWVEPVIPEVVAQEHTVNFPFDDWKSEVEWYDLDGMGRALRARYPAAMPEVEYVLALLGQRNRETEVNLAKGAFLSAWNAALKVALVMLFKHVSEDRQEAVLFELLNSLLAHVTSGTAATASTGVLEILCESVLVAIKELVGVLADVDAANLPIDQLAAVLQQMLEAVTRPGTTENARGNLYAAIGQYLRLLPVGDADVSDDAASAVTAASVGAPGAGPTSIHRATFATLAARKERFLGQLCRDAVDDRDVWKTACFSLLCALMAACKSDRDRTVLVPVLIQGGYLPLFVRTIKDREMALQDCLSPDHDNLHAFWVYEAKLAFLLAVASSRRGAEALLDAGVFEVFATCGFVNVQPINEDVLRSDATAGLVLRQHRVLLCALQLLARVLSSLARSSRSGAGHAISFLNAHRDAILLLLREDQTAVSLTGIEEMRLIVSIMSMVAHKVPADDLRSPSGFGAFHLAVVSAAARFFERGSWVEALINRDEEEAAEGDVLVLNQTLLVYLCTTTMGLKAREGNPVFVLGAGQRGNGEATRYLASAPSLGMAVDMVAALAAQMGDVARDYDTVVGAVEGCVERLSGRDVEALESGLLQDGVEAQVGAEQLAAQSRMLYNMIESLLLLLWRHLLFYANDLRGGAEPVRPGDLSSSLAFSKQGQGQSQIEGSRSALGRLRALERVAGMLRGTLELVEDGESVGYPQLRSMRVQDRVYFDMLVRRLRELIGGLTGEGGVGGDEKVGGR